MGLVTTTNNDKINSSSSPMLIQANNEMTTINNNRRKKKKKKMNSSEIFSTFNDQYELIGEILGSGSYGRVETCRLRKGKNKSQEEEEFAVKLIEKVPGYFSRAKVLREIETFYLCQGQPHIIQLLEFYEDNSAFYLIFEKLEGGPLLDHLRRRSHFTEMEASLIIRDLAKAITFLHKEGIAHRDLKPENILCISPTSPWPVKLGDFDLCSAADRSVSTPKLQTPVGSLEYMAPEVLDIFLTDDYYYNYDDDDEELTYNKKCDLWSLGVILHILLIGYPPFSGNCGNKDCGWDRGEACSNCQSNLSFAIKEGKVDFNVPDWLFISEQAKDLVAKLLVKDANSRLSAKNLLLHPWIKSEGSTNRLTTPSMLRKQSSIKDLTDFAKSAITLRRTISQSEDIIMEVLAGAAGKINPSQRHMKKSNSFDLTMKNNLMQRRIKDQPQFAMTNRFSSIDENH